MRLLPYLGQWAKYQICYNIRSFPRNKSLSVYCPFDGVFFWIFEREKKVSRTFERGNTFKESRNFISHWIWTDYRIHNSNSKYRLIQWKCGCGGRMLEIPQQQIQCWSLVLFQRTFPYKLFRFWFIDYWMMCRISITWDYLFPHCDCVFCLWLFSLNATIDNLLTYIASVFWMRIFVVMADKPQYPISDCNQ